MVKLFYLTLNVLLWNLKILKMLPTSMASCMLDSTMHVACIDMWPPIADMNPIEQWHYTRSEDQWSNPSIDERPAARDALCQLQCCKPLYTNNANRSIVSLVRTFCKSRFYSATCSCIVFHTHRDKRLNYRAKSTQCSVSHKLIHACRCITLTPLTLRTIHIAATEVNWTELNQFGSKAPFTRYNLLSNRCITGLTTGCIV